MNLKHLTNGELHSRTKAQAELVREESTILIHHLVEVERRFLFAKYKCSNLFHYCVDQLKMSEGQAGRYSNAAKVMGEFPEVEEKLLTGSMNMTSISQAQVFFNREEALNQPLPKEEKQKILEQIENQSTRKAERILLSHSSQPEAVVIEKVRAVTPTLTEIKLVVDDETLADLERMKEIWSHSLPDSSFSKLVKKMARFCVETTDPMLKAEKAQQRREKNASEKALKTVLKKSKAASSAEVSKEENQNTPEVVDVLMTSDESMMAKTAAEPLTQTSSAQDKSKVQETTPAPESSHSRYIHSAVRHAVYLRDEGSCEYRDPVTGERCSSRHHLQLDHIIPYAMGGENTVENLRLRCFAHNRLHAVQTYGHDKVMRYARYENKS